MVEQFFSLEYADRGDLFQELSIWQYEEYRRIQGTYPVISLSFANMKEMSYEMTKGDLEAMNAYMNRVALQTFSCFDTGKSPAGSEPERFYHGFVLGLMVDLQGSYFVTSNRESGFGRYDVMLEPNNPEEIVYCFTNGTSSVGNLC